MEMASVLDVARLILEVEGPMSTVKLQRLVVWSQAWSLTWDDAPLFPESVRAWRDGPAVRALFGAHRGRFELGPNDLDGDPARLSPGGRETVAAVLRAYGAFDGLTLSEHARTEPPWIEARRGAEPSAMSDHSISHEAMRAYYGSL